MLWSFLFLLKTKKGGMNSSACLLTLMRRCHVLVGDFSLKMWRKAAGEWLISQVIGILSSMGQCSFLGPACQNALRLTENTSLLLSVLFYSVYFLSKPISTFLLALMNNECRLVPSALSWQFSSEKYFMCFPYHCTPPTPSEPLWRCQQINCPHPCIPCYFSCLFSFNITGWPP